MKKSLLLCACSLLCANALADNTVKLFINGEEQTTEVTKLTFQGDNVIINGSNAQDMAGVKLTFTYDPQTTAINHTENAEKIANQDSRVFNLNGQLVARTLEGLPKGIYIQNGKKYVVK